MNCRNCNIQLSPEHDYCNSCGAKIIKNRLTIKNLFEHFSEQFFNYDNKFLKTFIHLFSKPEVVIGGYINGTRKKYVNVISYFAIALTISGFQIFILNKFFPDVFDISSLTTEGTEEFNKKNLDFMMEYQSIVMMLSVPIYALMSKLVFLNFKQYNYTEHLVIFMYVLAEVTIISAVFTVISAMFGITLGTIAFVFTLPFQLIYSAYILKRLFKLSLKGIILKTILFLLILAVFYVISIILVIIIMFLNGDLQELIEAQKAAKEASGS